MSSADVSKTLKLLHGVTAARSAHENMQRRFFPRFSPTFNPFLFIGPGEIRLSRVIAWLLDPKGSHGQRSLFLKKFLQLLALDELPQDIDQAGVQCEEILSGGRLDISILTHDMKVIIENKINAADGKAQMSRYFQHLDAESKKASRIVYLSLDGSKPSTDSLEDLQCKKRMEEGELVLWSYDGQFSDWLRRCAADCVSTKVRDFLDDFYSYVDVMKGKGDFLMKDLIVDEIVTSGDNITSAFMVSTLLGDLKANLFQKLADDLSSLVGKAAELTGEPYKPFHGIRIGLGVPGLSFVLEFNNTDYRNFAWGVSCNEKGRLQDVLAERKMLLDGLGSGNVSDPDLWLWYQDSKSGSPFPSNWNNDPGPWVAIFDKSVTHKFADCYQRVTRILSGTAPVSV